MFYTFPEEDDYKNILAWCWCDPIFNAALESIEEPDKDQETDRLMSAKLIVDVVYDKR